MQVVTPENNVEFITTGKVAEFKPPTVADAKADAKPDTTASPKDKPTTGSVEATEKSKSEPQRDADGKFVKAEAAKADDKPAGDAKNDADEDAKLTEKVTRLINKKHREMKEAQEFATGEGRRAIEAERRAEQLQREIDALKGKKAGGPDSDDAIGSDPDEPKPGAFKTVGEYTRALVKYEAKKAGETGKAQAEQSKQQEQANQVIGEFVKRQEAFKESTPDYEDVVSGTDLVIPNVAMQYLIESDVGPQLGYYLAKNPGEVTRLQKLSPARCVAELGKLETKLEKPAAPNKADAAPAKEVSKAPAPIRPLEGKEATVTKDPRDMNFQELRAYREAERRAKASR
jgi:hypothetical protein